MADTTNPYRFADQFELAVLRHHVLEPRFWGMVGRHLEPDALRSAAGQLVAKAVAAIAQDTGRGPGSGTLVVQRLARWREEGRVTHEQVLDASDLLDDLDDWEAAPPVDGVIAELVPIMRERRNREAVRLAMKRAATREDMGEVIQHLQATTRLGMAEATDGITLGPDALERVRTLRQTDRLPLGIAELDAELGGGPLIRTLTMLMGGSGDGKCHAAGQGILMANGSVKLVEDIRPGNRVMGPDGQPRRVLKTNTGEGEMYEVRPVRGAPWRVNVDHILTLQGIGRYKGQVVDVPVKEWLGWAKRRKAEFKLMCAPVETFGKVVQLTPIDPYFLGVLLGDGSFCNTEIRVSTADAEIADEVRAQAEAYSLGVTEYHKPGNAATDYAIVGTMGRTSALAVQLEQLDLRGLRSGDKFIPEGYKRSSRAVRLAVLAGLMDTDGAVNKTAFDFVSKSRRLADDVAFVARSLGFAAYVSECQKTAQGGFVGTYYRVGISGDVTEIPVRVPRKKLPARRQCKSVLRTGFTVVPTGSVEHYYGFTLEGDGRYLLDDFTVTHNSMGLAHATGSALLTGRNALVATLELADTQWICRLLANLTGVPIDGISDGTLEAECAARLAEMPGLGHCEVGQWTPGATQVSDLLAWADEIEQRQGWRADVLVVDYADLMGHSKARDYEGMREVYAGLREEFAVKRNGWVLTASQTRRKGKPGEKQGVDDGADSQHKIRVSDLAVVLRMNEDGTEIEWYVAKNRNGKRGSSVSLPTELECARVAPMTPAVDDEIASLF